MKDEQIEFSPFEAATRVEECLKENSLLTSAALFHSSTIFRLTGIKEALFCLTFACCSSSSSSSSLAT